MAKETSNNILKRSTPVGTVDNSSNLGRGKRAKISLRKKDMIYD
jgi:hypothetical protein